MYIKSKIELNYNRFVVPNLLGAARLVHSDLGIYWMSFFLLDVLPAEDDKICGKTKLITLQYFLYQQGDQRFFHYNLIVRMHRHQLLTSKVGPRCERFRHRLLHSRLACWSCSWFRHCVWFFTWWDCLLSKHFRLVSQCCLLNEMGLLVI